MRTVEDREVYSFPAPCSALERARSYLKSDRELGEQYVWWS